MANKKISALTGASTPLAGTEVLPIVQSGSTVKVAVSDLTAGRTVNVANLGVGATPSAWSADYAVAQFPLGGAVVAYNVAGYPFTSILSNAYYDGTNWKYLSATSAGATSFRNEGYNSDFVWSTAPTGVAGNNVTFTTRMTLDSFGNLTNATGNYIVGTAAKGINFTANTPAAGMTSQLLNWYEEGTWTPTIIGTTTAGTGTYSAQLGRYTRIGRTVYIQLQLIWTAHTGTGNMKIAGLPFTSNASIPSQMSIAAYNMSLTALYFPIARQEVSTTQINLLQSPIGGGAWVGIPMDTNVDALEVSGSYTV